MEQVINNIIEMLKETASSQPLYISLLFGFFLIILESIIPILPLAVFIAINMIVIGNVLGFILSCIATICGCLLSYFVFYKFFSDKLYKYAGKHERIENAIVAIKKVNFTNLVIIMAIPFTPAFSINIAAGITKTSFKKFFCALVIAKPVMVYFWGFIGTTLIESLSDVTVIVKIVILLIVVFVISKIVLKKFNLE